MVIAHGCRDGRGGALSAWLADHTDAQVLGVDLSDSQLAHARRLLADGKRPNLRFVQQDVMRLSDLSEPPFDAAICLDAACYLPDRLAALREIATLLRPGGRLLLVDWCRADRITALQRELILEPLCRYWAIADLETTAAPRIDLAQRPSLATLGNAPSPARSGEGAMAASRSAAWSK